MILAPKIGEAPSQPDPGARRPGGEKRFLLAVALAACGILWLGPYWAWTVPFYFRASVLGVVLAFLAVAGSEWFRLRVRTILLGIFLVGLLVYFGAHRGSGGVFEPTAGWLVLLIYVLVDEEIRVSAFRYFALAFAVTLIPGLIISFLSAAGIHVPWQALSDRKFDFDLVLGNEAGFYRKYWGAVVLNDQAISVGSGEVMRLHGMYPEPGTVGTLAALLLVANGMEFRGRALNLVLALAGALSLSLAFYVIVFVYLLLRRPVVTVIASVMTVTAVALSTAIQENPLMRLFFLNRLTFNGGRLVGDNRVSVTFEQLYGEFWRADLGTRLFGSNQNVGLLIATGTFSYKVVVFAYGVIGIVALIAFLTCGVFSSSRKWPAVILLVVFVLSIYQRPDVLSLPYMLVLLGGAAHLGSREHTSVSVHSLRIAA